jgi:hypothetical protein
MNIGHALPGGQEGPTLSGTEKVTVVLFADDEMFVKVPLLKLTMSPVGVNPLPVTVTRVPTGPDVGMRLFI